MTGILPPVVSRADLLLLEHPGAGTLLVTRVRSSLARDLADRGLVTCESRRNGALAIALTDAGRKRRSELAPDPVITTAPPSRPAAKRATTAKSSAPRSQAPRTVATPSLKRTPLTKRVPSLDEVFGAERAAGARPITVADLDALEARLIARFEALLDERLRTRK